MNYRGKVLNELLLKQDKFNYKGKTWMEGHYHRELNERIESNLMLSHVLAIRSKIREYIDNEYNNFEDINQIVKALCEMTDSWFVDVCFLSMGFGKFTNKEIDKYDLDFSFYVPHLRNLIKYQVKTELKTIASYTLEINFN